MMREQLIAMFSRSAVAISSALEWLSQRSTHVVFPGQSAPVPERSTRSRVQLRLRPESLFPHTKRGKHTVKYVFDIHSSNQFFERRYSRPEMNRCHGSRKTLQTPSMRELLNLRERSNDRLAMT